MKISTLHERLIGYWTFDEKDGIRAFDRSGNGNHGELVNCTRDWGIYGRAVVLAGADNSHVSIPGSESLNSITDQLTVTAWVFPSVTPKGFRVVVSRQVRELLHPDQFYLGFGPKDGQMHYKWHLGIENPGGPFHEPEIYQGVPEADRWIHMAGTYDGSIMRLFVDGEEIGTTSIRGKILVDDNPVTVGAEENGPAERVVENVFQGLIDEVRIYGRALDVSEIRAIRDLES